MTYIGAAQTASHGSGDAGTCGDFIVRLTIVDSWGNIKSLDRYEGGREGGKRRRRRKGWKQAKITRTEKELPHIRTQRMLSFVIILFRRSHPDFLVFTACLGMCGIVLDATVQFLPDTTGVTVTQIKVRIRTTTSGCL